MNKITLFIVLIFLSSCSDGCYDSFLTFTQNYERDVTISKEMINSNIGKPITISEYFDADLENYVLDHYQSNAKTWELVSLEFY
jgi:hypothetical protein